MTSSSAVADLPGYTIPEVEAALGLPEKAGYRLVREGKIDTYRDVTGRLRVSVGELHALMKERQRA